MPTIIGHLQELLQRVLNQPEIVERVKPFDAALEKLDAFGFEMIRFVQEAPPSPGYEPWLIDHGVHPIFARPTASIAVRSGKRVAADRARLPIVVSAVKFLTSPGHYRRSISRRVAVLLAAWNETSVIETVFLDAGLNEFEFTRLLQCYADGDRAAYPHLVEIAASLAPHLPVRRGPRIRAASAAHEFFLENVVEALEPGRAFTWSESENKCTDSLTETTRREFNHPRFDPRPAYRRSKAHKKTALN